MVNANFDSGFAHHCIHGAPVKADVPSQHPITTALNSVAAYGDDPPRLPKHTNEIQTSDRTVRVTFRMDKPVIAWLENLLAPEECDELIHISRIKLQRSTTVDPATGRETVISDRTSAGTFFALRENALIDRLDQRISTVMHWPIENGEGLQILNYQVGGEYKPHFDFFPPEDPGSHVHLAKGGQRVSTMVVYLNDVPGGGNTIFPECNLSVTPHKGSAVYFEYCNRHGQLDKRTLHGGAPVTSGEKWIATKWMRQNRYV